MLKNPDVIERTIFCYFFFIPDRIMEKA